MFLSLYLSAADMIDSYYIKRGGDTNSIDEPTGPYPIPPTLPPVIRPDMNSPIWSYSEDETTPSPSILPTELPSLKPSVSGATLSPSSDTPFPSLSLSPSTDQCMVSVMLDLCPSLLESIQPKEGCNCYNFCGGIYLGCCAIDEPCPLTCDVLGGFVAGCRIGYTSPPISPNPLESEVPSINPSYSPSTISSEVPTLAATLTSTTNSTEVSEPTETPESSQTIDPTTLSPTQVLPPTNVPTSGDPASSSARKATLTPTNEILSIPLAPFTLEYEVAISRPIAQSDIVVLTSITNSYLQSYMLGAFQSEPVLLVDFVTKYDSLLENPESAVVLVTFTSTALFDPYSGELPSRIELETELALAFMGMALTGYLGMLQALPKSNAFSTTSEVFLVQNPSSPISLESKGFSTVAAATITFAFVIVTFLAGFSWYRTRRKRRRLEASDKFLRNDTDCDSIAGGTLSQANDEDTDGVRDEERLSMTLLDEIERIEDMRRNFEDHTGDRQHLDRDDCSRDTSFKEEEEYLYEDDSIENDEEDWSHEMNSDNFVEDEVQYLYEDDMSKIGMKNENRDFDYENRTENNAFNKNR